VGKNGRARHRDSRNRLMETLVLSLEAASAENPHGLFTCRAGQALFPLNRKSKWKYRMRCSGRLRRFRPGFENSWGSPKIIFAGLLTDVLATVWESLPSL
jgi:hypothetical protein